MLGDSVGFLSSADFFKTSLFFFNVSGISSECQDGWRCDLSGLIWIQTVCKSYQRTTAAEDSSRQGVNILQVHYSDVCKCHTVLTLSLLEANFFIC